MTSTSETSLQVNTFGFNLPCRQFVISAERTRERRLPMVDEFILRTLHLVGSIPAGRLARFFGFEGRDLGVSISDLQSNGYIRVEGDSLSLSALGKELFRTSDEEAPTLTVAEPLHADVWFDLATHHMVSGRGLRNVQHLIQLRAPAPGAAFDVAEARQAFHAHFRDYLRIARKEKNPDQWNLYSILDAHAGRYSYAQITGSEILRLHPAPKLEAFLLSGDDDYASRARRLTEVMVAALSTREHVESSSAARLDYSRLAGNKHLDSAIRPDGFLDLSAWLQAESMAANEASQPIVGYPYVERNRALISRLLASAQPTVPTWELWWLRPGGTKWGVTEDLPATLEQFRATVRAITRGRTLTTMLVAPAAVRQAETTLFQRVFERGVKAPAGKLPLAVEVLVIPDVLAVTTVAVPLSPSVTVPVGFATIHPDRVRNVMEVSNIAETVGAANRIWPSSSS